jgi:hypothetical protein
MIAVISSHATDSDEVMVKQYQASTDPKIVPEADKKNPQASSTINGESADQGTKVHAALHNETNLKSNPSDSFATASPANNEENNTLDAHTTSGTLQDPGSRNIDLDRSTTDQAAVMGVTIEPVPSDRNLSSDLSQTSLERGKTNGVTAGDLSNAALRRQPVCYHIIRLD